MKINNLVSIIIPCYNQAQYLEETVMSAIEQTYPNIEIIIVNDGSTDDTAEVAHTLQVKYPEKIRIIAQKNSGVAEARNNGVSQSLGQFILPLDSDDKLDKTIVEECISTLHDQDCDIVYTDFIRFGIVENTHIWKPFDESDPLYITPCSVTALFKQKVWKSIGGYNKIMHDGYEDWEFWVNAYKNKFKFYHLNKKLFYYRTKNISRDTIANTKDTYLKAKIIMIHPELYNSFQRENAIETIKNTEKLADVFFYHSIKNIVDTKNILSLLNNFLSKNKLNDKQIISDLNENIHITLYSLDVLESEKSINNLSENINTLTLFYSSFPYSVPNLKVIDHAWSQNRGIVKSKGNSFHYVFKSQKENFQSQLIACKRLESFLSKKETYIENQSVYIKGKDTHINEQASWIKKQEKKITELEELQFALGALSKIRFLYHPLKKFKSYKKLMAIHRKLNEH